MLCTDRASVLVGARVEQVGKRRTSGNGLWTDRREQLHAVTGSDGAAIRAALADATQPDAPGARPRAVRAFATSTSGADSALVCRIGHMAADRPEAWPATYEAALVAKSAVDRFSCHRVVRRSGRWRISVD